VGAQLVVAVVVEALDRGLLDRPVHPLDLAATQENSPPDCFLIFAAPRMVGFGQAMLDPVRFADHVEAHWPGVDGVPVARLLGELDAVVGQDRVDLVGHGLEHVLEELLGRLPVSRCNELGDRELGCPVDAHEEVELSLDGLHLGNVDVEEPDGVALELLALGLVAFDIRLARDAVTLQAAMQRRPCQMRDRGLESIETIVQRQERMATERHHRRLLLLGKHS